MDTGASGNEKQRTINLITALRIWNKTEPDDTLKKKKKYGILKQK
jgi:hypothetical protein